MSIYTHYIEAANAASAAAALANAAWAAVKPRRLCSTLTDDQHRLAAQSCIASAMEKAAWTEAARVIADNAQEPSRAWRIVRLALCNKSVPDALNNEILTVEVARAIAHEEAWAAQRIADYWVGAKAIPEDPGRTAPIGAK